MLQPLFEPIACGLGSIVLLLLTACQQHGCLSAYPLSQGDRDADQESFMYTAVQEKLKKSIEGFQPASCCTLATATAAGGAGKQPKSAAVSGAHMAAGLELCRLSKLLLIAGKHNCSAFLCCPGCALLFSTLVVLPHARAFAVTL